MHLVQTINILYTEGMNAARAKFDVILNQGENIPCKSQKVNPI